MTNLNTERILFTEPMAVHTNVYPNAESMKPILTNIIQEQGDQQKYETNVKAHMTTWDMYKNEYFKLIIEFAIETLKKEVDPYPTGETYCTDSWGAIYKPGERTDPHAHWPSLWSFVYYVDACPKCSPLVFPGAGRAIKPNTGLIIIFPGDVSHYVPKQECEHNRVIISGNITIKLDQAR